MKEKILGVIRCVLCAVNVISICMYEYGNILCLVNVVYKYMYEYQPEDKQSFLEDRNISSTFFISFIPNVNFVMQKAIPQAIIEILTSIYGLMANIKRKKLLDFKFEMNISYYDI